MEFKSVNSTSKTHHLILFDRNLMNEFSKEMLINVKLKLNCHIKGVEQMLTFIGRIHNVVRAK